jgi:hypothetical protein
LSIDVTNEDGLSNVNITTVRTWIDIGVNRFSYSL